MRRSMAIASTVLMSSLTFAAPAHADETFRWMDLLDAAFETASEQNPNWRNATNSRAEAQLGIAMFEAANAVEGRYESFLGIAPAPGASAEAAVASAGREVLVALFPDSAKSFDDGLALALVAIADGPAERKGVELGKRSAKAALARAALPANVSLTPYRPHTEAGRYIDPGLPSIHPFDLAMPPFVLESASALRPAGPPALASEQYARDLDEVRRLGAKESSERPADKTMLARPLLWINYTPMLQQVMDDPARSLAQNARTYALAWMAAEDGWLAVMDAKMHFETWRPITAIRNADIDGNEATTPDPAWEPLLKTPTHPDYPCGHCGFAAAIATVLEAETGPAPSGGVRIQSFDSAGLEITVPTWKAFVDEMSMSRIYAGAHTRFANDAAETIGREAARITLEKAMTPTE